jgi:predicted DNA-binding protein
MAASRKSVRGGKGGAKGKTSVYLDRSQRDHLRKLAKRTGRAQAQLIREAIESFEPAPPINRNFALAAGFRRIDGDPRPTSAIPDDELLAGFGE